MKGARFEGAILTGAAIPTVEPLLQAGTLMDAQLDPFIETQVREKMPELLEGDAAQD